MRSTTTSCFGVVMAADPTAVEARVRVAGAEIQRAARKRDSGEAASAATMVMPLLPHATQCHSDLHAHAAASKLDLSSLAHSSSPLALIDHRWPNVAFVLLQASSFQQLRAPVDGQLEALCMLNPGPRHRDCRSRE